MQAWSFEQLAQRHQLPRAVIPVLIVLCGLQVVALAKVTASLRLWWLSLAVSGSLYALIATRRQGWPGLKEGFGAACFTWLVWGSLAWDGKYLGSFWLLGLSNFLWSSHFDRTRDQHNTHQTMATRFPSITTPLARLAAAVSCILWAPTDEAFACAAVMHAFWPKNRRHIDFAFLGIWLWWGIYWLAHAF